MTDRKSTADRKREIENIALRLAFQYGPEKVTTGMIATEIKLSQPAIYKHFPCKEKIWIAVAHRLSSEIYSNIDTAEKRSLSPVTCLRSLVLAHLILVRKNPALPDLMIVRNLDGNKAVFQGAIQDAMSKFHKTLAKLVCAAIEVTDFRSDLNPNNAASLILGVIQSLVLRMMISRNPDILLQEGEDLLDELFSGFTSKGSSQ